MSINLDELPPRAENEEAPHLVTTDAWQRVQDYLKLITVKDDGGVTSQTEETADGIIVSRA